MAAVAATVVAALARQIVLGSACLQIPMMQAVVVGLPWLAYPVAIRQSFVLASCAGTGDQPALESFAAALSICVCLFASVPHRQGH